MNNFTICFEQQFFQEIDSVTYSLEVVNFLGTSTILVHILKQGRCIFVISFIWYYLRYVVCVIDFIMYSRLPFLRFFIIKFYWMYILYAAQMNKLGLNTLLYSMLL